jgi:hypothetical protein
MKIKIGYQYPYTNWSVTHVFKQFHEFCVQNYQDIEFEYLNYDKYLDGNPSSIHSPHNMRLINEENDKFIVVSYWDKAIEMTWRGNGWDYDNCVDFITSAGTTGDLKYTPFSYLPYLKSFSEFYVNAKQMFEKEKNELIFRGFLYDDRLRLSELGRIKITNEKIYPEEVYFEDLTNNKICLSLNGAGEICNRDFEILSARSVLFRPILKQKFHNELISNYHYVGFDYNPNPNEQTDIILDVYNKIKNDEEYLHFVSENGYNWYKENGTINANTNILTKIIDFNKLK